MKIKLLIGVIAASALIFSSSFVMAYITVIGSGIEPTIILPSESAVIESSVSNINILINQEGNNIAEVPVGDGNNIAPAIVGPGYITIMSMD